MKQRPWIIVIYKKIFCLYCSVQPITHNQSILQHACIMNVSQVKAMFDFFKSIPCNEIQVNETFDFKS